jgi:glycosyltransferase involved in cell wall biosynthesis
MTNSSTIVIISPCFNENITVLKFIKELESILEKESLFKFHIVIVDDASTDNTAELLQKYLVRAPNVVLTVLRLTYNIGHQGAIHQGLLFAKNIDSNKFIVIDSDGEDDPNAILELVRFNEYEIIHVARSKRNENLLFILSYNIYKIIFKLIAGKKMNFGNYCMLSKKMVNRIAHKPFIHLAAHLSKLKVPSYQITYERRQRIDGKSKMNLTSLIHHAFKSFIEYAEDLLMVFLKLFFIISILLVGLLGLIFYKKFYTHEAILGWASTLSLGLFTIAVICFGFFVLGILLLNLMAKKSDHIEKLYEPVEQLNEQVY